MFTSMTANDLAVQLADELSPEQMSAAQGRLQAIQDHLVTLNPKNIVANWGTAADNIFDTELDDRNCYLKRDEMYFKPVPQPQTPPQASTPQPTGASSQNATTEAPLYVDASTL
jgi:hypothetical protein